jgi:polar amino acid transport system substrate-binding protein
LTLKQSGAAMHYEYQMKISEDQLSIALRKNEPQLKSWLNEWIGKNLKNGTLNAIWHHYFGIDLPASLLGQANG